MKSLWKKWAAGLLAFSMAAGTCVYASPVLASADRTQTAAAETADRSAADVSDFQEITLDDIYALNGDNVPIAFSDGKLTYLGGTLTSEKIEDERSAYDLVLRAENLLLGSRDAGFLYYDTIKTPAGTTVYIFQEIDGDQVVYGSAVKVAVDADGTMRGLFSYLEDPVNTDISGLIDGPQAVQVVEKKLQEEGMDVTFPAGRESSLTVLPGEVELDVFAEEEVPDRLAWVVYSDNPAWTGNGSQDEKPYLAHYVTTKGEYLYSMPVKEMGDAAALSGYDAEYAFDGMEQTQWTGKVLHADGKEETITVPVMKDKAGRYYLGDTERRIAVADFWSLIFDNKLELLSKEENEGWDDHLILLYNNYIRAYDFYKMLGWDGPDGHNSPMLILDGFCEKDHTPVDNAAYLGKIYGWQCFSSSEGNTFYDSLDVIAHEYTHSITSHAMGGNIYINDSGAINESFSDIMGNLCEAWYREDKKNEWLIGEDSGQVVRDMGNPNAYQQPSYTWDQYYATSVEDSSIANDNGGVHANSSLLSLIAYYMDEWSGLSLEEDAALWLTAACVMTGGVGYSDIENTLLWALDDAKMGEYAEDLASYAEKVGLQITEVPEKLADRYMLTELVLPNTEAFEDDNWVMVAYHLSVDEIMTLLHSMNIGVPKDQRKSIPEVALALVLQMLDVDFSNGIRDGLRQLAGKYYSNTFGWPDKDRIIRMVQEKGGWTFYVLINISLLDESFEQVDFNAICFYLGGRWYSLDYILSGECLDDVSDYLREKIEGKEIHLTETDLSEIFEKLKEIADDLRSLPKTAAELPEKLFGTPEEEVYVLSSEGLENVKLNLSEMFGSFIDLPLGESEPFTFNDKSAE